MRAFLRDSSPPAWRRQVHSRAWLAAFAAAVLIAALAGGTATAATPTTVPADDPTVITDWNALA
jgi:hypothetical protein